MEEKKDIELEEQKAPTETTSENGNEVQAEQNTDTPETEETQAEDELESLRNRVAELEDLRLRQIAEFDNYRRRTNKEKLELIETAGERIFKDMLPLIDDFERAASHGDLS